MFYTTPPTRNGTALRAARLTSGVPQYVVAKRAKLQPSRLSVLERGYDDPTGYERAALSRVLGVPQEQLFPVPVAGDPTSPDASSHPTEPAPGLQP
jgi:transcriptional regulator with XRE-family HTH domain